MKAIRSFHAVRRQAGLRPDLLQELVVAIKSCALADAACQIAGR